MIVYLLTADRYILIHNVSVFSTSCFRNTYFGKLTSNHAIASSKYSHFVGISANYISNDRIDTSNGRYTRIPVRHATLWFDVVMTVFKRGSLR